MDETGQPVYGTQPLAPPPVFSAAPPPAQPPYQPAYPPYAPMQEPAGPSKHGRGWLIALGIIALFFIGAVAVCGWAASFAGTQPSPVAGDAIALIHIDGVIAGTGSNVVTPEGVLDELKSAEDDRRVKAILLRIDSPGGTVAASEEIASEIARASKPVVASIGDVGASGAYMVASQCDSVVAAPGSTVGSIGVILEVADLQGLLSKLGVKFAVITAGAYKDIGSPYRSLTATETEMLQEQVDLSYEQFIDLVAVGRNMPKDEVRGLATGFAWVGTQAKDLGLVDELGNYNDAIDVAAKLGKIKGEPQIVTYEQSSYLDALSALIGLSSKLDRIGAALETKNLSTSGPALSR
jgi:protease-4